MSYCAAINQYQQDRAVRAVVFVVVQLLHRVKRLDIVHHRRPGEVPRFGKPLQKLSSWPYRCRQAIQKAPAPI